MLDNWKKIPALLQTPLGRLRLRAGIKGEAWPVLRRVASLYRRTLVRNTCVVAVVGSFGKSTTMRAVTAALGRKIHPRAELNAKSAVALAVLRIRRSDRHAVIEVGIDAPGKMLGYSRLVRPNVTVVTSIGSEHNRSLKTLEVTRSEKAEMVRILPASGLAVLNGDDPNVMWMQSQTRAQVMTFGFGETSDVRAQDLAFEWPDGMRLTVCAAGETRVLRTRLVGKHMAYPVLAALAVALAEGVSVDQAIQRLEALTPTSGRMEPVRLPSGAILLRDENKSTLETIEAALDALAAIPAERRIVVHGEVSEPQGSQGPIYRSLGARTGAFASRVVFVGNSGVWSAFGSGAKSVGLPPERLINAGNSIHKAVEALRGDLGPGDIVLVKGRDTQRLERISLALTGREVRCEINQCQAKTRCGKCPMLEGGWNGDRVAL